MYVCMYACMYVCMYVRLGPRADKAEDSGPDAHAIRVHLKSLGPKAPHSGHALRASSIWTLHVRFRVEDSQDTECC